MATTPFNAADYLKTREDMILFLDECYVSGDRAVVRKALDAIIEAVRRDEREACAKLCDDQYDGDMGSDLSWVANLIRARHNNSN